MEPFHLNCVEILTAISPAVGHCLLLKEREMLAMMDLGIGRYEVNSPYDILDWELVASTGLDLKVDITAVGQLNGWDWIQSKSNIAFVHIWIPITSVVLVILTTLGDSCFK
ncbi:hypothetical protein [Algoriphagus sp. Y33]|uniref:hypothetical protein n=1 Tax=Algoriphagus sp. Y33 TaxID=2772483 RepID=UPI00177E6CA8|nr:hypothetical protein [Algoriphagus sp. Y33]